MSVADELRTITPALNIDFKRIGRAIRYAVVGASGIPVDMAIVGAALHVGTHYLLAQVVGFTVAVTWNFSLNHWWTFNSPDGNRLRQYLGYVGVQLGALGARMGVVAALVELVGLPVLPATFIGIGVPVAGSFLVNERWVFGVFDSE